MPDNRSDAAKKANYVGGRPKDESRLSQKPSQIRNRLRRAKNTHQALDGRVTRDIERLYQKPIEDWDLEELARGRPRNPQGNFRGTTPGWVTASVMQEARRRLHNETFAKLVNHVDEAIKVLAELMVSEEVDDKGKPIVDARTKLDAAKFVVEHIIGKPTTVVEVSATEDAIRTALVPAIILDDGAPQGHLTIDLEDDEWEEEDQNESE